MAEDTVLDKNPSGYIWFLYINFSFLFFSSNQSEKSEINGSSSSKNNNDSINNDLQKLSLISDESRKSNWIVSNFICFFAFVYILMSCQLNVSYVSECSWCQKQAWLAYWLGPFVQFIRSIRAQKTMPESHLQGPRCFGR